MWGISPGITLHKRRPKRDFGTPVKVWDSNIFEFLLSDVAWDGGILVNTLPVYSVLSRPHRRVSLLDLKESICINNSLKQRKHAAKPGGPGVL